MVNKVEYNEGQDVHWPGHFAWPPHWFLDLSPTYNNGTYSALGLLGGVVVGRQTCDRQVASSTPGRHIAG